MKLDLKLVENPNEIEKKLFEILKTFLNNICEVCSK